VAGAKFQNPLRLTYDAIVDDQGRVSRKGLELLNEAFDLVYARFSRSIEELINADGDKVTLLTQDADTGIVRLTSQATGGLRLDAVSAPADPDAAKDEAVLYYDKDQDLVKVKLRDSLGGSTIIHSYLGGRLVPTPQSGVSNTVSTSGGGGTLAVLLAGVPALPFRAAGVGDGLEMVFYGNCSVANAADGWRVEFGSDVLLANQIPAAATTCIIRVHIAWTSATTGRYVVEYIEANAAGAVTVHQVTRGATTQTWLGSLQLGVFILNGFAGLTVTGDAIFGRTIRGQN